ncbi:MAG: hypothetical protein ABH879_03105 [archaeon]
MLTNPRAILRFWILLYVLATLIIYLRGQLLYDYMVYVVMFALLLRFYRYVPAFSAWTLGLGTLWHAAGVFPFQVSGETVTLYSHYSQYDLFTHFCGFLMLTLGILHIYVSNHKRTRADIVILLVAVIGLGAVMEISEYLGYRFFGYGEGWIRFGDGDNSANFGPWGDSMTDSIANVAGVILGCALYFCVHCQRFICKNQS